MSIIGTGLRASKKKKKQLSITVVFKSKGSLEYARSLSQDELRERILAGKPRHLRKK